jgi:hypothetical protein
LSGIFTQPFGGGGGAWTATQVNVTLVTLPGSQPSAAAALGIGICPLSQSDWSASLCASTSEGSATHEPSSLETVDDFASAAADTTSADCEVSSVVADLAS